MSITVSFIVARLSLFENIKNIENIKFKIVELGGSRNSPTGIQYAYHCIPLDPKDRIGFKNPNHTKDAEGAEYIMPTFYTYSNDLKIDDIGYVTIEKSKTGSGKYYLFHKIEIAFTL